VVMLYWIGDSSSHLTDPGAPTPLPTRKLVGFERVSLAAGASLKVSFAVTAEALALVDDHGDTRLFAGRHLMRLSLGSNGADVEREFAVARSELVRTLQWY
jgi:hypothetical protein